MRLAVFGAGSVGCYIGGRLAVAGAQITLIGRDRIGAEVAANGLRLSDYTGFSAHLPEITFALDAAAVAGCEAVLVCVKSQDSAAAAKALRPHLDPKPVVISFQNGVSNAATLAGGLNRAVVPGMVGFNVAAQGQGRFHQGTQGDLHIQTDPRLSAIRPVFDAAGLGLITHADMRPVLWAKLMLNLNNAVNALANVPLRDQVLQRDFRLCLALAQEEMLALARIAGLPAMARLSPLPASFIPRVLRLPTPLFRTVARSMLRIDPVARSSMSDDLALGREPEVAWINGEVVRLAESLGRDAPVNRRLQALVFDAARAPMRPTWQARDLLAELRGELRGDLHGITP